MARFFCFVTVFTVTLTLAASTGARAQIDSDLEAGLAAHRVQFKRVVVKAIGE